MTISEVLSHTKIKNNQKDTVKKIEEIAIAAAKVINSVLPCRDYGIDFGINQEGKPILFEVNTTPESADLQKLRIKQFGDELLKYEKCKVNRMKPIIKGSAWRK